MLKGFYKGINFGGWFSQCDYSKERLDNFITENDFKRVAGWGADHVRIPVDYNIFENNDGTYKEDGFSRIHNAVQMCIKYGLNAVIDLHKTAGFSFDNYGENESGFFESEELQERFYRLWEQLAQHFEKYGDSVAFELLNEVTDKSFIVEWNRISQECIKRIRKYAPRTLILVGSYWNNSAEAVKDLAPPVDDRIVYNMHCYEPLKFTHQGAYWTDMVDPDERISFEDAEITPALFEKLFMSAIEKADKHNVHLYCGEYGVIDKCTPEDTVKWFRCINSVFEKYGISRCLWSYKEMDFGFSDERLDCVREELLKYI